MSQVTTPISFDITKTYTPKSGLSTVTDVTNLPVSLGTVFEKTVQGMPVAFKFVLVEDKALVVGDLVCYTTDDNGYEVTSDRSGGTSDNTRPAGMAVVAIADGACGWIQIRGLNVVAALSDGSVAAGEMVIPHATSDGVGDSGDFAQATGSTNPLTGFGQALDADGASSLPIGKLHLMCQN